MGETDHGVKFVYLIFSYGEYGPEAMFATLTRESLIDEFKAQATAFCRTEDIESSFKELDLLMSMDDCMLLEMGNMPLVPGWGGACLRLCVLE